MHLLTRLIFVLPGDHLPEHADAASAFLALHVPHGWAEDSRPDGALVLTVHSPSARFCDDLQKAAVPLAREVPGLTLVRDTVPEQDWTESWKEFFTPVRAGSTFLVLAPWMERERAATTRIPIIIEPKTAFGTGHHATTALCLEALSLLHEQGQLRPETRFLDLGTGSGILGLGCALLGLRGEGLDIDQAAVENAQENRGLNGVLATHFDIRRGGAEAAAGPYDLIMANILAAPLKELAPLIVGLLGGGPAFAPRTPGSDVPHSQVPRSQPSPCLGPILILSGILDIQAQDVENAYTALGLPRPRRMARDEWVALLFGPV